MVSDSSKKMETTPNNNVIELVEDLAFEQGQPDMPDKIPIFTWEPDTYIDELNENDEDDTDEMSRDNEPIDLGFMDPRAENIVSNEDESKEGDENTIIEPNTVEEEVADEANVALGATLIESHDDVESDYDEPFVTGHTPNGQEDVTEDDHSAHSSEWSFNLSNVLDEDQDDPIMNEIIDDA